MKVVIYTANVGDHDEGEEWVNQAGVEVEFRRFNVPWPPPSTLPRFKRNDRLAGRWFKTHPHVLFPSADFTIWVDACLQITSPDFAAQAIEGLRSWSYAVFQHPDRTDVYEEVEAADTLAKYDGADHRRMLREFEDTLGKKPEGLWAMTTMVRGNHPLVRAVDHLVWAETVAWSTPDVTALDQLILPFAADLLDHHPVLLDGADGADGNLWANQWFVRHPHRRDS